MASFLQNPTHQAPLLQNKEKKDKKKLTKALAAAAEAEGSVKYQWDTLPWNPSIPEDNDPFASPFAGATNESDGGFLSLEEIDEFFLPIETCFHAGDSEGGGTEKIKKKKNKRKKAKNNINDEVSGVGFMKSKSSNIYSEENKNISNKVVEDELLKAQFHAWDELRLHPLLMKSIYELGFKEPTPIQKASIAVAAHRGKDLIGAAETGSGKTLAFGLPILQRLLEEREKSTTKGNSMEQGLQENSLRALIVAPTRELVLQVVAHLKAVAKFTNIKVIGIIGGLCRQKQDRLLKSMPEIIVGTPGRLWEYNNLLKLQSLSFFVLDEADRMVEEKHFQQLEFIIEKLPKSRGSVEGHEKTTQDCVTVSNVQQKKRQTLVFSATIALSADFRKKLKHGSHGMKASVDDRKMSFLEKLSKQVGIRDDAAFVDFTNTSILTGKLEESFIECSEEDKDAYLYYLLSVHGKCRTIVFCMSIAASRHVSSLLLILGINVLNFHSEMQQKARLKALESFRGNEHAVLVAADGAARGLDIPGVRTVIHYQLPHSAEVYVHRSGRTARAFADGCSIALISPTDRSKFASLCRSFSKESYQRFPLDNSYIPEVKKRLSLACQIEKILRKDSQEKASKSWFKRSAESLELVLESNDSEEERVNSFKQKKRSYLHLKKLQQELNSLLSCPLQPKTFSQRFLAGSGVSPLLQCQFQEIAKQRAGENNLTDKKKKFIVLGQDCTEPLEALRNSKNEGQVNVKEKVDKLRSIENLRRKRKLEKKGLREKQRKQKKQRNRLVMSTQ